MNKINSLALLVGTGQCNAHCNHCAGIIHRKYAPKKDGIINSDLIYKTIKYCYGRGARALSLSSSGEPTLSPVSVTKVLKLVYGCRKEGIEFSPINLYSNGIKIGEDKTFCDKYLYSWKDKGLTRIYITVHDIDENKNAKIYGVKSYPSLEVVSSRIHNANLLMRANLVLTKNNIGTLEKFITTIKSLKNIGMDLISAWPIRNIDDKVDLEKSPLKQELDKIQDWIQENPGFRKDVRLLREDNHLLYQTGQKLTLFPDGTLSNTWCNF
jgi:molybdenum cofactor biosynthesis enzyme MoaA